MNSLTLTPLSLIPIIFAKDPVASSRPPRLTPTAREYQSGHSLTSIIVVGTVPRNCDKTTSLSTASTPLTVPRPNSNESDVKLTNTTINIEGRKSLRRGEPGKLHYCSLWKYLRSREERPVPVAHRELWTIRTVVSAHHSTSI